MSHTVQPKKHGFCREHPLLTILIGVMTLIFIAPIFLMFMFDFRHTKSFAAQELSGRGFEQVVVLKKYTIGHGMGMPSLPMENWFDFRAIKNGKNIEGRLVCYRQYWDIKESRCKLADY